jgi:drug/metabolite transporter (DMT)-like permease
MVTSAFCFALMGAAIKLAAQDVPNSMVVFFRNSVSLAVLLPWAVSAGPRALATRHFDGHLVRALAGLAAMSCYFFALGRIRLADATLLNQAYPLFLPLAERVWLGTRVEPRVVRAVWMGFAGMVIILRPGSGVFTLVAVIGACSALFASIAQVGIRQLTRTEPIPRIVFYFALIATTLSAMPLPWTWVAPTPVAWLALIGTGLFATFGQLTLTRAYAHAPAAMVGPFVYAGVLFAALFDWVAWRTAPDWWFVPGALLIVAAGIALLRKPHVVQGDA